MRIRACIYLAALALAFSAAGAAAVDAPAAGHVTQLSGSGAEALLPGGSARKLASGDAVYSGETIKTDNDTTLSIKFEDESQFSLGRGTEFQISKFSYRQSDEEDSFQGKFLKGVFRFVSGVVAHNSGGAHMSVRTPVATIGIRGTHVGGEVNDRQVKDGVQVDASAKIMLLEPEDDKKTSIVVSNEYGSVVIDKPGYGTEIPDEKSPPSPVRRMQINTLDNILRSLHNAIRQSGAPRPR